MSNYTNGDFDPSTLPPAVLAMFPAMTPPEGQVSNFINPASRAYEAKIALWITLPLMLLHVFLRLYTRLQVTRSVELDDYTCILAACGLVAYCALLLQIIGNPLGPHQWNVRLIDLSEKFIITSQVAYMMYSVLSILVKSSILFLYRRLFWPRNSARYMVWIGVLLIVPSYLGFLIGALVYCVPRTGENWLSYSAKSRCAQPQLRLSNVQGVFGIISDIYLLAIPVFQVSQLRVSTSRKVGIAAIFLTGLLACVCSITLCVFRFNQAGTDDFTWNSIPSYALAIVELNVGVICSCMPIIFVVVKTCSTRIASTFRSLTSIRSSSEKPLPGDALPLAASDKPDKNMLPEVPKGGLSTLRSFFGMTRQPNGTITASTTVDMNWTNLTDLDTDKDSYHAHIVPKEP